MRETSRREFDGKSALPSGDGPGELGEGRAQKAGKAASSSSHTKKKQILGRDSPLILAHRGYFKQKGKGMVSIMVLDRTSGVIEV